MAFIGRALRINLDTASTSTFDIPSPIRELYLGGRGLTAGLMYHFVPPDTAVRSPDNPLLLAPGVLAGTPAYATGGFVATTRSPLTGNLIHSWAVGDWGAALKRAGFDAIWVVGQATAWPSWRKDVALCCLGCRRALYGRASWHRHGDGAQTA